MKTYKEFKAEIQLDERYDKDLDKNKNGKLDKKDFELLRKKKSCCSEETELEEDASVITDFNDRQKYNALRKMEQDRISQSKKASSPIKKSHHLDMANKHNDDANDILDKYRLNKEETEFDFDAELINALFENASDVSHPVFNPKGVPVRLNVKRDIKTGKLLSTTVAQQSELNKDKYYNDSHNISNNKDVDDHINYIKKAVKAGMSVHHTAPDNTDEEITPQNVDAVTNSIKTAHKGTVPAEYANRQANLPPKKPRDTKYDLGTTGPGNRSYND